MKKVTELDKLIEKTKILHRTLNTYGVKHLSYAKAKEVYSQIQEMRVLTEIIDDPYLEETKKVLNMIEQELIKVFKL